MSGQGLPSGELPGRPPEKPLPKAPEVKQPEAPLGGGEQNIVNRIQQDGDPDRVLQDIAGGGQPNMESRPQTNEAQANQPQTWEQMLGGRLGDEFRNAVRGRVENNLYHNGFTMREFVKAHPQEARQLLGSYRAQYGEVHPQLLQAIHDVDELTRNPIKVPPEDPKYAGLAYNRDSDPKYKAIADQLDHEHKRALFGTDDPEAIKQIPLERFMDLVNTDQNLLWSGRRDARTDQLFRQQFPDQDRLYREREITRVYRDPDGVINPRLDPAFPTSLVPLDENIRLREFAQRYPDKAKAYVGVEPRLKQFVSQEPSREAQPAAAQQARQEAKSPETFDWSQVEVDDSGPPIVGGEIITPTARLINEPNDKAAQERGWLAGITSAYGKTELSIEQRRSNVQEIVNAARAAGIPREKIKAQLDSLGIRTVSQEELNANASAVQAQPEQTVGQPRRLEDLANLPYERIARELPIDEQKPPVPEAILPPMGGNMFGEDDNPTLAGRVVTRVYNNLLERPDKTPKSAERAQALIAASKAALKDYSDALNEQARQRQAEGKPLFANATDRQPGTDGFHVDGKTYLREFMYYFNKSKTHWKNANEPEVRAYLTLSQSEMGQIQRHFVDLATQMYDAGIDFTAKAASPAGMADRTDNMVFYISASDQPKASELMKKYLAEKGIGKGHVLAAQASPQEGLSWALEPGPIQDKIWQEVSGSTQKSSFNTFVATMAMPAYLDRLAEAHVKLGNNEAANTYRQEAQRVKTVIAKYQTAT